jgi:hypothetical protein
MLQDLRTAADPRYDRTPRFTRHFACKLRFSEFSLIELTPTP